MQEIREAVAHVRSNGRRRKPSGDKFVQKHYSKEKAFRTHDLSAAGATYRVNATRRRNDRRIQKYRQELCNGVDIEKKHDLLSPYD
jgi:hypothetical protein